MAPRPRRRNDDAASNSSARSSRNDARSRIRGGARRGHPQQSQANGRTSDSELSDGTESLLTIQIELEEMKRNLVEPEPGVHERENIERTVQNLANLKQTIPTVLGTKARTSRP